MDSAKKQFKTGSLGRKRRRWWRGFEKFIHCLESEIGGRGCGQDRRGGGEGR